MTLNVLIIIDHEKEKDWNETIQNDVLATAVVFKKKVGKIATAYTFFT